MPFYITEWGQLKSNEPSKIWNDIRKQKERLWTTWSI